MKEDVTIFRRKLFGLGTLTLALMLLAGALLSGERFAEIEARTWDWRLERVVHRSPPDPAIKLIVVDQTSLDYYAREESIFWQWPREMYEPVIRFLEHAGARGVAFDVLYTEPSPYGVADDRAFVAAITPQLPVVMAIAGRRDTTAEALADVELFRARSEESARELRGFVPRGVTMPRYSSATLPIPEILQGATALGNVTSDADSDGVFRHVAPIAEVSGVPVATLPLALHRATGNAIPRALSNQLDDFGRLAVRFHGGARTYPTFSIGGIIQSWVALKAGEKPALNPAEFKDAFVFVGMVAPGLLDLRPIPLAHDYPGVEFNATVLDNLRHDNFIRKVGWPWATLFAGLLVIGGTASALFFHRVRIQLLALTALFLSAILGLYELAAYGWWMPMVIPLGVTVLGITGALALQYELEGRQHRFIKEAFRHYVSPSVIDQIVADPTSLALGGARRELTIFFSDIAGFTTISEQIEAAQLSALLNRFLSEMTEVILRSGGTVDKYVGDAIVAFWNAPLEVTDHATRGVLAALACQARLEELQEEFRRDFGVSIRMRVGLHTGVVSVGNFGSRERFNYTMIGDAANLASRLEGANKYFGTDVLVSAATRERVSSSVLFRKVADIQVVGKSEVTTVFEPYRATTDFSPRYEEALELFEAGDWLRAAELFRTLPSDAVARAYLARIEREAGAPRAGTGWVLGEK